MDNLDKMINSVEKIMTKKLGGLVRLKGTIISDPERRNLIMRCKVLEGPANAPETIIVKQSLNDRGIMHDWAGYELLSNMSLKISPEFYGGDLNESLIAIEDIGEDSIGLHKILLEGKADEAEKVLIQFAEKLGQMHASTIGKTQEEDYQKLCSTIGIEVKKDRPDMERFKKALQELGEKIGLVVGETFFSEMEKLLNTLFEPGPFWAFSHGDPCLDNWLYDEDRLVLIDYEFGRYQHALLDGVYGRAMFPTCWCTGRIPEHIVEQMEERYRKELVKGCPEASDDILFYQAVTEACGFWAWSTVLGRLSLCLEANPKYQENIPEWRSQIYSRLNAFIAESEKYDYLPQLRNTSHKLLEILKGLWPEVERLAYFPAFRDGSFSN